MATKKKKTRTKQKQKQKQSQNVIINLASPKRRTKKPRQSATPNTSRVLAEFIQPQQVLPDRRTMINPVDFPSSFMTSNISPIIRNPERPISTTVTTPNQPRDVPLAAATTEGRRLRLTPSQLRSVSAAKAVAREEDRKIKRRLERNQEAERGLMAAEDATSFMTQTTMANQSNPFMTPLQPIDVPTPISSPMNDPFSSSESSRKSFGRQLTFM
jgi:hypothetical protein